MSESRRKTSKGVKFEDTRSGSSRASTIGGSSTSSSGHSGSQYTPEYNVGALEETLRKTIKDLDEWKRKALDADDIQRKSEDAAKARIKALEHSYRTLEEAKEDVEKQYRDLKKETEALKKENSRLQRKLGKDESQSEPSSPDSGKIRRSDSKKSKDPEGDRLKQRFNRTSESPTEITSSKPPSSSRSKHSSSSSRRLSVSSERPPYMEGWGPGGPPLAPIATPASNSRRPPQDYITTNLSVVPPPMQSPGYATPRSTVMTPMRPTVEYATYGHTHEAYPVHQLARR